MSNAAIRRAVTRGLVSAVLIVAQTSSTPQVRSAAQERNHVAQFCAPSDQEVEAPRFYCQNGDD
jgi:hypothetical protein